jgi:hypothetical protein
MTAGDFYQNGFDETGPAGDAAIVSCFVEPAAALGYPTGSFKPVIMIVVVPSRILVCLRWLAVLATGAMLHATSVVAPEFPELVGNADYIVRAVVKSVTAEMIASPTGKGRKIVTRVELEVREVIAGTPPSPLVLQMLGGKVGDEEMRVEGAPRFQVGDEDILFLRGNGRQFNPLVGLMHGRYPIRRDAKTGREFVTRNDASPLRDSTEVSRPFSEGAVQAGTGRESSPGLTPDDFANRIRAMRQAQKGQAPQ